MVSTARENRSPRGLIWLLVFLMPYAALAVHQWSWGPPAVDGDYAQYLLHAKAIVEGRPYADTGYIFHPAAWSVGPRAYPPGLPLTLAPLVAVVGVHSLLFRLLMLASGLAFAYLAWRRLATIAEPWQAAAGVGFALFAIESRWGMLDPISDPGFAALVWGMVLAVDTNRPWNWRRILLVTALGGAVLSYRVAGVALIAAFAICALVKWPGHGGRAAVPLVLWALGGLVFVLSGVHLGDILSLLTGWRGLTLNADMVRNEYGPSLVVAMLRPSSVLAVNRTYYVCAGLVTLVGVVALARRFWRSFLATVCVAYSVMLIFAPVGEERYMWPLYPVAACALAVGITKVLEWLRGYWPALPVRGVAVSMLAVIALSALGTEVARPKPDMIVGTPDGEALFAWLREAQRTTPMRVAFFSPRVVALETGIPTMANVGQPAPGQMRAFAEAGITHLICQPDALSDEQQQIANSLPRRYPDRFTLVYQNSRFQVYQLLTGEHALNGEMPAAPVWRPEPELKR